MRLIDADELYKHVMEAYTPEECATKCAYPDDFITRISDMPTIDQWHYLSKGEYPPSEDASYFVTLEHLRGFKERFVTTASYYKEYGWGGFESLFYRVVAWMPLPEPPKEEQT